MKIDLLFECSSERIVQNQFVSEQELSKIGSVYGQHKIFKTFRVDWFYRGAP
jgi:hypothetical protein